MREYVKKYLGVEPVSFINEFNKIPAAYRASVCQEYPELKGHEAHDYTLVHNDWFDAATSKVRHQTSHCEPKYSRVLHVPLVQDILEQLQPDIPLVSY